MLKLNSCSSMRRMRMLVAMIAGCAFSVYVSSAFVPDSMILVSGVRGNLRVSSISSRMGFAVRGKASSHGVIIPTRCTPWPCNHQHDITTDASWVHLPYQGRRWPSSASARCSTISAQLANYQYDGSVSAHNIAYMPPQHVGQCEILSCSGLTWRWKDWSLLLVVHVNA